jgi:hypothetical protein
VTVGTFAPSASIINAVKTHPGIRQLGNPDEIASSLEFGDICSRIIVTSDYEGRIRVFVRGLC